MINMLAHVKLNEISSEHCMKPIWSKFSTIPLNIERVLYMSVHTAHMHSLVVASCHNSPPTNSLTNSWCSYNGTPKSGLNSSSLSSARYTVCYYEVIVELRYGLKPLNSDQPFVQLHSTAAEQRWKEQSSKGGAVWLLQQTKIRGAAAAADFIPQPISCICNGHFYLVLLYTWLHFRLFTYMKVTYEKINTERKFTERHLSVCTRLLL